MRLSDISISRPVFATVMSLIIVLLGLVSYNNLTIREYPNIDEPAITVTTAYPGASAQLMEAQVTKIVEDSIAGIEGIKTISSISREGTSLINIRFNLNRNQDDAAAEVRDRVARVRGNLPDDIQEPIVAKVEADSEPILWVVPESTKHSVAELTDIADRYIQDQLQTIDGVAEVYIFGARRYAMRVWLDPLRLAAHALTTADVERALRSQNLEVPSGRVEGLQREFSVLSNSDVNSREQFEQVVVATREGHQIQLKDVARVSLGVEDDRVAFRFNRRNAVGLGIVKQSVANPLDISREVDAALPSIQANLPDGITIRKAYDSTDFIRSSIDNVYSALLEAVALVVAIILLFLRSPRAALIPIITIPVSLIGAFALMSLFGFSINTLTLLAMVLAIGLVVDDAIVVLENIYRHVEEGMPPLDAARKGAGEIGFAVIAMTITLAAVYVPVAFMEGRTGKLFTEFALTLASSVIISGFVALTLTPMMSGRLLKSSRTQGRVAAALERGLDAVDEAYRRVLARALAVRWTVFPALAVVALATWFVFSQLRSELSPLEDRGALFMAFIGPEGATVDYMAAYAGQLEEKIASVPEISRFGVAAGIGGGRLPVANQGLSFMGLTPWDERGRSSKDVAADLGPKLWDVPGVLAFPILPASLGANFFAKPVEFVIKDSAPYEDMAKSVDAFLAKVRENPRITNIDTDLKINTPQLKVNLARARLADLGISVADAAGALETMLAGREVTRFKRAGEQYDVILRVEDSGRTDPESLERVFVRTAAGSLVPLSAVVNITDTTAPRDLNHFDRMRSVTVTANLADGYALGEALSFLEQAARDTLPQTARVDFDGQSREFRESSSGIVITFGLALLFIFLVLSAQFESFIDPLIILITVPLTILGALVALWLTGNTLNIYSQIGLITLVGLISKHGILIVEFANKAVEEGKSRVEAAIHAATLRLRPILMTTGAMVLGAVPLVMAEGAGAESRHQLGWVIVGGMSFGTLLTLFVVPAFYTYFSRSRATASAIAEALPTLAPVGPI
jgi:multidrug efflux pump